MVVVSLGAAARFTPNDGEEQLAKNDHDQARRDCKETVTKNWSCRELSHKRTADHAGPLVTLQ
jgi:hypothetical protein